MGLTVSRWLVWVVAAVLTALAAVLPCRGAEGADARLSRADALMRQNRFRAALTEYKSVADSLGTATARDSRIRFLNAVYGCAEACFRLNDYSASFDYLLMAEQQPLTEQHLPTAKLHANYTALYIVIGSQTGKREFFAKARAHSLEGFDRALAECDTATLYRVFCDMSNTSYVLGDFPAMAGAVERMRREAERSGNPRLRAALKIYEACRAFSQKEYARADTTYLQALRLLPDEPSTMRQRASLRKDRAYAISRLGRTEEALSELKEAERVSYLLDMRDMRLNILNVRRHIYEMRPEWKALEEETRLRALDLRDSLQSVMIVDDLTQMEYTRERRELMRTISLSELRHRWTMYGVFALIGVVLIFGVLLMLLRHKNLRLQAHVRLLLDRMRSQYRNPATSSSSPAAISTSSPSSPSSPPPHNQENSEIAAAVRRMLASEELYSPDMSLTRMAELAACHPKTLSRVVHEEFGCGFPALVNRARIVEACRRIESPEYARYSLTGIGESVGFNNRTSFTTNFKKYTGLGLREYRKAAER